MAKLITFRIDKEFNGDRPVVEVWLGDLFIASIYPHANKIVIVSKYLSKVVENRGFPSTVSVEFDTTTK
ncbi:MAG: hypothetical protein QW607_09685 [Desulfurococcaceae archaeon]